MAFPFSNRSEVAEALVEVEGREGCEASREEDKDDVCQGPPDDLDEEIKDEFCVWVWQWGWKDACPSIMSWIRVLLEPMVASLVLFFEVEWEINSVQRGVTMFKGQLVTILNRAFDDGTLTKIEWLHRVSSEECSEVIFAQKLANSPAKEWLENDFFLLRWFFIREHSFIFGGVIAS